MLLSCQGAALDLRRSSKGKKCLNYLTLAITWLNSTRYVHRSYLQPLSGILMIVGGVLSIPALKEEKLGH